MAIIGPGLTLVGGHFNTSLVVVAAHSTTPPTCEGLDITANALKFPLLYVHTRGYSHGEMTIFNSLRKLTSNFMAGAYEQWIQVSSVLHPVFVSKEQLCSLLAFCKLFFCPNG
jgi:hypothetical protein